MLHPWLAEHLSSGRNASHADDKRHRLLQASYYGLMSEVDDNMGRLFAHLEKRGVWDDTLVIFTSDHGEQMGDHWLYGKSGFFDQSYHIPLLIRWPGARRGARVTAFTEHVDIMPTVLDWLRLDAPRQCDGRSLQPLLRSDGVPTNWRTEAHWEYDFRDADYAAALVGSLERCSLNVVRGHDVKYVHFADLPPLLFDLGSDPHELIDRAADPAYSGRVAESAQRLLSWRMAHTDKTLSHMQVTQQEGLIVREATL